MERQKGHLKLFPSIDLQPNDPVGVPHNLEEVEGRKPMKQWIYNLGFVAVFAGLAAAASHQRQPSPITKVSPAAAQVTIINDLTADLAGYKTNPPFDQASAAACKKTLRDLAEQTAQPQKSGICRIKHGLLTFART